MIIRIVIATLLTCTGLMAITAPAIAIEPASAVVMAGTASRQSAPVFQTVADSKLTNAQDFISKLGDEAISIMEQTQMSDDARRAEFRALLNKNFDMNTIGRFTLGRYWRIASKQQQTEFQSLFKDMVLNVYSKRFSEYSGQRMAVTSARYEGKKDIMVNSHIISPDGGQKIRVDWRVRNRGSESRPKYKVIDVIVEGISMSLTQRSDFASIIQRNGGNIQPLLVHLGQ